MTVDEELTQLEDGLRRLKVEYDIYFGGGSKRLPQDLEWRVQSLIKRFSEAKGMNFAQRFRYNSLAQKYAVFSDLWRQKSKIKEEGYRRPADALLAIQGLRAVTEEAPKATDQARNRLASQPLRVALSDTNDNKSVHKLYDALCGKQKSPDKAEANFKVFESFLAHKTQQIKTQFGCKAVEYEVAYTDGKLNLKARPKT